MNQMKVLLLHSLLVIHYCDELV